MVNCLMSCAICAGSNSKRWSRSVQVEPYMNLIFMFKDGQDGQDSIVVPYLCPTRKWCFPGYSSRASRRRTSLKCFPERHRIPTQLSTQVPV